MSKFPSYNYGKKVKSAPTYAMVEPYKHSQTLQKDPVYTYQLTNLSIVLYLVLLKYVYQKTFKFQLFFEPFKTSMILNPIFRIQIQHLKTKHITSISFNDILNVILFVYEGAFEMQFLIKSKSVCFIILLSTECNDLLSFVRFGVEERAHSELKSPNPKNKKKF